MKKWMSMILALVLAVLCIGCGGDSGEAAETTLPENQWGVVMQVKSVSPAGATVVLTHSGEPVTGELTTGSYFVLEQLSGGEWVDVPMVLPQENVGWTMEAYLLLPGQELELEASWSWLYGELAPGTYRIGKDVTNFRGVGDYDNAMVWAEFTIGG